MISALIETYSARCCEFQVDVIGLMNYGFVVLTYGLSHFGLLNGKEEIVCFS